MFWCCAGSAERDGGSVGRRLRSSSAVELVSVTILLSAGCGGFFTFFGTTVVGAFRREVGSGVVTVLVIIVLVVGGVARTCRLQKRKVDR